VLVLPDFIANAGGVICAAVEWMKGSETQAMIEVEEKIRANMIEVLTAARDENKLPREAAMDMAQGRVLKAMSVRES